MGLVAAGGRVFARIMLSRAEWPTKANGQVLGAGDVCGVGGQKGERITFCKDIRLEKVHVAEIWPRSVHSLFPRRGIQLSDAGEA